MFDITHCMLCPRRCGVDRTKTHGACGASDRIRIARAAPHFWEEPCISGKNGSGAIFFSGCSLGCSFCQNYVISHDFKGVDVSVERFEEICFEFYEKKVHNINLVTADHYVPLLVKSLEKIKKQIKIPIVYNCSGYQSKEILGMLDKIVDVYLPDIKYYDSEPAMRFSNAPRYFETALEAVQIMQKQTGNYQTENGMLVKGTMLRHMVIPGYRKDSIEIIKKIGEIFGKDEVLLSVMSQYTPNGTYGTPTRRITSFEYDSVVKAVHDIGFEGYIQERSSAKEEYTPPFDFEGVTK